MKIRKYLLCGILVCSVLLFVRVSEQAGQSDGTGLSMGKGTARSITKISLVEKHDYPCPCCSHLEQGSEMRHDCKMSKVETFLWLIRHSWVFWLACLIGMMVVIEMHY